MSCIKNGAHSAPKGYDLRVPYNVPMGEIQVLRVVPPFSTASYQKDTVTGALPQPPRLPPGFPRLCHTYHYHHAHFDQCKGNIRFQTVTGQHPPFSGLVMEKLYNKNSRIK